MLELLVEVYASKGLNLNATVFVFLIAGIVFRFEEKLSYAQKQFTGGSELLVVNEP